MVINSEPMIVLTRFMEEPRSQPIYIAGGRLLAAERVAGTQAVRLSNPIDLTVNESVQTGLPRVVCEIRHSLRD